MHCTDSIFRVQHRSLAAFFAGVSVAYLYSLYDALVSISVPSEKARAVVDAMERDMSATSGDETGHRIAA